MSQPMPDADTLGGARIVGVHTTPQRRRVTDRTPASLAIEALTGALDDAGLEAGDLDGLACEVDGWPLGLEGGPRLDEAFWARQLGHPLRWMAPNLGIPTLLDAASAITNGRASAVALLYAHVRPSQEGATASWTRRPYEFTGWTGSYTAVQYALVAQRYLHDHGDDALQAMAEAAATIRNFGHLNPNAVYTERGPYTADEVLASPMVAAPLTRLMCSAVNDGAAAIILVRRDWSGTTARPTVRALSGTVRHPYPAYCDVPALDPHHREAIGFAEDALVRAGVSVDDIDVVELYDHFAIGVLLQFELLGFCGLGEASEFVLSGAMRLDGLFPTCTDGGNLSFSHTGWPMLFRIIEAVRQLRGEVPDRCPRWEVGEHTYDPGRCRAVADARTALVTNPGPPSGGGSVMVLARD